MAIMVGRGTRSRKVLTLCFNHETNTFSSQPTTRADFEQRGLLTGQAIDDVYRGTATEIGGFIQRGEELGLELVHVIYARAQPAGLVADDVAELVWAKLSEALDTHPDTAGVLLALHGALITESHDDGEGFILERLRRKVGPDLPIIATLDLHAHCSETMVENASALIGYKTYPHVDYVERAVEATDLMASMIAGASHPTMAMAKPPMIPMVPKQFTGQGTAHEMIEKLIAVERNVSGVISATLLMGFPWADVFDMGCAFVVVTEDDLELAQRIANELSEEMWLRRDEFMPDLLTPAQAVVKASQERDAGKQPVVMPDMSDNPGGGGAMDSVAILSEFLARGVFGVLVGSICDAEVVSIASSVGIGGVIEDFELGGKTDALHGPSLHIPRATVVSQSDGEYTLTGAMMTGSKLSCGPTAVLELPGPDGIASSTVVVCSWRQQILDPCILRGQGQEPTDYDFVVLKSAVHFRSNFTELAGVIVEVTGPGIHSSRMSDFLYEKVARPLWPLDGYVETAKL